ncbi:mycothiol maleylpyruvate isomerase [Streptomyces solincola]|uniref:Mycothiol maleylpyruvate isomerase n=1 Tax=Streptomyces solincola TaxID=2100817 RepID=A0A2S9PXA1_9ACTN|nr:maleylpyruvate isomerase family mycothiol-dependent enzyme [Streptomyces solincola]PRH78983.1 mycothiol maleylpyruvate isomerase [Streptomyces solincola]
MIDPVQDLAALGQATDRLLAAAAALDETALAAPSRLPGWSRGHVLAHLARNADALVNVLRGLPMYVSGEAREKDIERDAPRPSAVQVADVRDTAELFAAEAAAQDDWERRVELRNGVTDRAARVPFRRLVEIELHHVDLGVGYELEDLADRFTAQETDFLADRFSGNATVPPTRLLAGGAEWRTGGSEGAEVTVSGSAADLVGWLAGRRDGAALTVSGGPLPVLPPL